MNDNVKGFIQIIGGFLAFLGVLFVLFRLNEYKTQLDFSHFNGMTWAMLCLYTLVYAMANFVLALAWWNLLVHYGAALNRLQAVRVFGLSQLAKYVPGNVIHLASRQAMGLAIGVRGWALAKSSVWEFGLISTAGALYCIFLFPQFLTIVMPPLATLIFVVVLFVLLIALKRYIGPAIAKAFGLYAIFLMISGMVFVGILELLQGDGNGSVLEILLFCSAFIVAWLAGLITPGAPAGIGVRESVLMTLLNGIVPESALLVAILLSRAVTVVGDTIFFLILFLDRRQRGFNDH